MKQGLSTRWAVASLALVAACGGGGDKGPAATLATPTTQPPTTTSTTLSPEAEVEAAYLKSWDVYTDAVSRLDASMLTSIYEGRALEIVTAEVSKLARDNTPVRVDVEHDYEIRLIKDDLFEVEDAYVNHSVLLDASTKQPIEEDPNERLKDIYTLQRLEGQWKVLGIVRPH